MGKLISMGFTFILLSLTDSLFDGDKMWQLFGYPFFVPAYMSQLFLNPVQPVDVNKERRDTNDKPS